MNTSHNRLAPRALLAYRAWAVVGVMAFAGITGGCGGGDTKPDHAATAPVAPKSSDESDQTDASAPDAASDTAASACALLSPGDVTAAMRQPMEVSGDGGAICSYSATEDASVVLYLQTFATQAEAATDMQLEPSSESIDGLGDSAFWNSTLDLVFVRVGDRAFSVTSLSLTTLVGDPQASSNAMAGLAKIVLQNF